MSPMVEKGMNKYGLSSCPERDMVLHTNQEDNKTTSYKHRLSSPPTQNVHISVSSSDDPGPSIGRRPPECYFGIELGQEDKFAQFQHHIARFLHPWRTPVSTRYQFVSKFI